MNKLDQIKKIKIDNKNKFGSLTPDEIIMIIINALKKNNMEVLYENVTALAFSEFPEIFALFGYPTLPDGKRVHDCLLHLGKHGKRLIVGDRKKGFDFSDKGRIVLEQIFNKIQSSDDNNYVLAKPPKTKEIQMVKWIKSTPAYNKFLERKINEITEYEIRQLLRGTNLSTSEYLRKSLDAYIAYAQTTEDKLVIAFLKTIERNWKHLFQRIKLRSKK